MQNIVLGNEYVPIDSTITAIMVRELIEGCFFCVTHIGAVVKNDVMSPEEKKRCLKILIPSILSGVSLGLLISIAIGISLVFAVGDSTSTDYGVEVGEGVSRLIGAFFVTDLVFKLPKWIKISNYTDPKQTDALIEEEAFSKRWQVGFSLFWNVLRESIEGGTLTAAAVILSAESEFALGNSVGVAIAATIVLAVIFGAGAKYVSIKLFGILATFLAQVLAVGLWTGAARSFEEVYAINTSGDDDEGTTAMIYNYEGTSYGDSLTVLEFMGFSYALTALTLSIWLIGWVVLTFMQVWHNYLGKPFVPPALEAKSQQCKASFARRYGFCGSKQAEHQAKLLSDNKVEEVATN